ncbi:MAG TPA: penicillin acylase family protein [Allosphingosinicella sp.]|nr:penicillin acylase family protein [Allosphingosinicella sp.]
MRFLLPLALLFAGACAFTPSGNVEPARWRAQAERVTITRDDWGIAHVRGRSDADAVFGMIYAQAEDDFNRVESNYLTALGRTAEAEGEKAIWRDLRARLYMDPDDLRARYSASPAWLKRLMDSWADGLNYYLATHPEVRPSAIMRFEPWMALSFTEGSIGGDIERIDLEALESFYSKRHPELVSGSSPPPPGRTTSWTLKQVQGDGGAWRAVPSDPEPRGSNGFAIAPSNSAEGHALLLINPHTSFFFRSELQVASDEGLNAYGAATWGQFFIYQGFNERAGWMHTSSGVDVVDEFLETVEQKAGGLFYRYGNGQRPVETKTVTVAYRRPDGSMASRSFETHRTHHGPIVREEGGKWVAFAMMHKPVEALQQSFLRTKVRDHDGFLKVAELKANSSNNTIFADSEGNIAYHHPHFIPVRDDRFDYTKPVDGSDPSTDWRGLHALSEAPRVINPPNGWIQNTNNWPYSAAGPYSPKQKDFPRYMDTFGETPRGIQAVRVLQEKRRLTLEGLRDAAYDPYQSAFARLIPGLVAAWDKAPESDPLKGRLRAQVAMLRNWDYRWAAYSVETALAMFWGERLWAEVRRDGQAPMVPIDLIDALPERRKLEALASVSDQLKRDFGRWHTPWTEVNRFQRLTGDIAQPFSDSAPSLPVAFTSGRWGSLASFGAAPRNGSKRWYGTSGNSFVAVVEFGPKVRAKAVTAGGESGNPQSPHFNDQAGRYAAGNLREVYFYPEQLEGHVERVYRPGR